MLLNIHLSKRKIGIDRKMGKNCKNKMLIIDLKRCPQKMIRLLTSTFDKL